MAEEYINPEDLNRISLAEMSVLEQLHNLARVVEDTVRETGMLVDDLVKGKKESIKARYERVRLHKDNAEAVRDKVLEYLVRVSPTLIYKDLYMNIASRIEKITQDMDAASYRSVVVAYKDLKLKPETGNKLQELFRGASNIYSNLLDAVRMLSTNPRKTYEICGIIAKLEEEVDKIYRELELHIYEAYSDNIAALLLIKEIADLLEDSSDMAKEASDYLKYLALHKY
jgi:uncharacterized protein Yka (UPF0111/DUF47 family)